MEHRNGFSSVSGSSIQKFDGKNYKDWAFEMELLLTQERDWSIVSGEENSPPSPVDEVKEEVDEDGKVIVRGKPAVDASNKYNDYLWRYHAAVRLIFMALDRSLSRQYMTIRDPVELWKAIKHDYIGELQKSHVWVKRDLYEVKLKDHGSIKAYAMRIQELIDRYAAGAKLATDRISKADHVFFLLNGIPQSDEWDVELRLITDQIEALGDDPRAIIKKLCDREDKIKFSRGITFEVALYTKSGDMASGSGTEPPRDKTPKILKVVTHLIKSRIYTAANLGHELEDNQTLEDAVYEILHQWAQSKSSFATFKTGIKLSTLKAKSDPNGELPSIVGNENALRRFKFIPSSENPAQILDVQKNLIGFRFPVPVSLIETLERTEAMLPERKPIDTGSGFFAQRNYVTSGDFSTQVSHSPEYLEDQPHSQQWLEANGALLKYLNDLLRKVAPDMWRVANNITYLETKPLVGAWAGLSITQGMKQLDQEDAHQDWGKSDRVFNCTVPYGTFAGADIILWQLGLRVQVSRGEGLFFFDSVLAHQMTEITAGSRSVVDLFTPQSNFEDRKRKFPETSSRDAYRKAHEEKKRRKLGPHAVGSKDGSIGR